jgi:hypothetical protein
VTEVMPRPKALTAAVFADPVARTLTIRQAEPATGYESSLWGSAWQALRRAYEGGWPPGAAPWVYESRRVIHAVPAEGGALSFTWPVGTPGFAELISKPGLYAIATVDINTCYFSTVKFLHRPG